MKAGEWNKSSEYHYNVREDFSPMICGSCEETGEVKSDGFREKSRRAKQGRWRYLGQHCAFGRG